MIRIGTLRTKNTVVLTTDKESTDKRLEDMVEKLRQQWMQQYQSEKNKLATQRQAFRKGG